MTELLIPLIIIVAIVCLIFWIADRMGLPAPLTMLIKGIAGLIAIVYLIQLLQGLT